MTSDVRSSIIASIRNHHFPLWPSLLFEASKSFDLVEQKLREVRPRNQPSTRAFVRQQNKPHAETSWNLERTLSRRSYEHEPLQGPRRILLLMIYPAARAVDALCCSIQTARLGDDAIYDTKPYLMLRAISLEKATVSMTTCMDDTYI